MSIAIIFNQKDPKHWEARLKEVLPNIDIHIYPNIPNPSKITFALCWKPSPNVLEQFPNLKAVQSVGAGVNHIVDTQQLAPNIQVSRIVDDQLSNDMFEFALATILAQMKNLNQYRLDKSNKLWNRLDYQIIKNTKVGILGLGQIGSKMAVRLDQLGFQVSGWARTEKNIPNIKSYVGQSELNALLAKVDYVINVLPMTKATHKLIDYDFMKKMKSNSYLINIGRGPTLVESDLIKILEEGHLSGAALDVFQEEPLDKKHPFWTHQDITITPHIASITNIESASKLVLENYRRHLKDELLLHTV